MERKSQQLTEPFAPKITSSRLVFTYSLAQRSALANGNLVTLLNTESGGDVDSEVLVALLVTGVLGDEVKVLSADDGSSVHLGGNDGTGQDTATDGDETGERALLVCAETRVSNTAPRKDSPFESLRIREHPPIPQ